MMKDLKAVLQGERIKGYPTWKTSRTGRISMISSSNKISRREEINELFEQLGQFLEQRVEALLIGGAVMLELGLKDATKDIDVVCRSEEDKDRLLARPKPWAFRSSARRRGMSGLELSGWL